MSEPDRSDEAPRAASDQTLMGVAPPPLEPSAPSPHRSPVFVRSGTSTPDADSPPVPRVAFPSPPSSLAGSERTFEAEPAHPPTRVERLRVILGGHPALWMLLAPAVLAIAFIALLRVTAVHHRAKLMQAPL